MCLSAALTALGAAPARQPKTPVSGKGTFESVVQPFLAKSCIVCHNPRMKSGELSLGHADGNAVQQDRDTWERVLLKIKTGEMPPKGVPRPRAEDAKAVTGWLEAEFERMDRSTAPDPGRVTARRLNRFEYNNTIRDLVGVSFRPADDFPADDSGYGFDHIGDVLSLSPVLMEKYMAAAAKIVKLAIVADPPKFKPTRERYEAEKIRPLAARSDGGAGDGAVAAGPKVTRTALHLRNDFPADGEYEFRISLGGVRLNQTSEIAMAVWVGHREVERFFVNPGREQKRVFDFRVPVRRGDQVVAAYFADDSFSEPAEPPSARDRWLTIDSVEIRGPFQAVPPPLPETHTRIISCGHAHNQHEAACARKILAPLARRAFRRPVSEPEIEKLESFVALAQQHGDSFERGIQVALQAMLVSPHFLFRIERDAHPSDAQAAHEVSSFELANRLSYFLWSSMPDSKLFQLAEAGRLGEPAVLHAQVKRMLADPKSSAFVENFTDQWLQLRNLEDHKPDPDKFPDYDAELRDAMRTETRMFFEAIVREDRPVLDFVDAKFTFLNGRLAKHYGIEGVEGPEFQRVPLDGNRQRGGVLTQASVLTVSSYPNRTSPVIRGKWILENLLNAPPPPPPPGVPNLDEAAVGNTGSLRQQLEKHRANATCASCHARMDPLGFGLENYDAVGAWRTQDGKFAIDSAGVLPNGREFKEPSELKQILERDERETFTRALTEKMLTYALARGLERYDRPTVNLISRGLAAADYRFSRLVLEIVDSMPFRMRRGDGGKS
jgi:mono/diheme cytochrome c family protein